MHNVLSLIFFLSGVSALIFETLWFRLVGLSLGNSVWSASLVLSAFMGGIALGNAITARLGNRIREPIRLYAGLELAIGIVGASLVIALPFMPALLGPLLGELTEVPWLLNSIRLGVAFFLLIVPATAMGATLPVLVHALTRRDNNFGASLGWLYGWNTFGAMLGAIASEGVLIAAIGVMGSGLFALILNLAAALIALRLARSLGPSPQPAVPEPTAGRVTLTTRGYRYLAAIFLSGAIMLAFEVVGFRFLLLSHDGTSLIFAIMLAVVLAGIAAGGLIAARLYRISDQAHDWLRLSLAASGVLVVATYAGFDLFTETQMNTNTSVLGFAGLAMFLMFPISVLSGIAFTMIGRAVRDELTTPVRTTGIVTLCNTVGAMLGSLLGGFVLLPILGMEKALFALALAYGFTAVIAPGVTEQAPRLRFASIGAALALAASLALFPFGLMQSSYFGILSAKLADHDLIATRESVTATIHYYRLSHRNEPHYFRLATNGYSMSATSTPARRYMKQYVYLPSALNPDMDDALLISYGVGSTAKALTDTAALEHIDIVDISRDILEMSSFVFDDAENPLNDPRVDVHVEDGRFFLNTTGRTYDLITSEPPPPKIAGISNLYSQEYFELIRSRLADGGYTTYWLPVHDLEPLDALAIVGAFCNAFADCTLWSGAGLDWMLMGSNGAKAGITAADFSLQWNDPVVGPELRELGFETPAQMGSLFMADSEMLAAETVGVLPVTDNFPLRISSRLSYQRLREPLYDRLMDEDLRLEAFRRSSYIARYWPDELKSASEPYFAFERMIKETMTDGIYSQLGNRPRWDLIDELLTQSELEVLPLWILGSNVRLQEIAAAKVRPDSYDPSLDAELALGDLARRDYAAAMERFDRFLASNERLSLDSFLAYMYTVAINGRMAQAQGLLAQVQTFGLPPDVIGPYVDWYASRFDLARDAPLAADTRSR